MSVLEFFVPGVPRPQGSKNHVGAGRLVESSKGLAEWRWRVGLAANQARRGAPLHAGAVRATLIFVMPRPTYMARTTTPPHTSPPDVDKLVRGVLDALSGTLIVDDAQVTSLGDTHKRYADPAEPPGVHITVEAL
ncbi:RusA family crossover junction endodeoxyribonuclease [Mycobacterium sp. TY815]|uniref:RusA family crossover junction endodeoxyribonuclease n=1 Tax=Mycobacterium sp. TY815 TaxID=3050581 RepID=UPI0027428E4C|nr:RusA family crossover junction endodeoxyribonuclease [Mycobacterium sp. TY815]MDP7706824.1 RusA family crossover junction endodeoxyribonuclease [Mycobacterium sp. TY815]